MCIMHTQFSGCIMHSNDMLCVCVCVRLYYMFLRIVLLFRLVPFPVSRLCAVCVSERERNCDRVSMLDCLQSHLTMVMCSSAITNCGHRYWLGPAIIDRRRLYDRQEEPPLFHSTRNVQCACVLFATSTKNPIPWHSNVQINTSEYRKIDK